jgi:hypothetical protein
MSVDRLPWMHHAAILSELKALAESHSEDLHQSTQLS